MREAGFRVVDGPEGRGESEIRLARRPPMLRDLGGVPRPERGENLGIAGMKAKPFPGDELAIDGLLQQGVAEAVGIGGGDDELSRDRSRRRVVQRVRIARVDRGEHVVIDARSAGRQHPQEAAGALVETVVAHQEQLTQRFGQRVRRQGDELLDEERHPRAAGDEVVQLRSRQLVSGDAMHLVADLPAAQSMQLEPGDAAPAIELGKDGTQGMIGAELVAAIRDHDQDPTAAERPEHVAHEAQGCGVHPVHVLQDEHEGVVVAESLQQFEHRIVQSIGVFEVRLRDGPIGKHRRGQE